MTSTIIDIVALLIAAIGIIGCILPVLPGPPITWVGMLLTFFWGGVNGAGEHMPLSMLLIMLAVTIAVTVLDYLVPSMITKKMGGGKAGSWGATIGLIVGTLFFPPWGTIFGSFAGAFIGEYVVAMKQGAESFKAATGAFLGFLLGTGIKLVASIIMFWQIWLYF